MQRLDLAENCLGRDVRFGEGCAAHESGGDIDEEFKVGAAARVGRGEGTGCVRGDTFFQRQLWARSIGGWAGAWGSAGPSQDEGHANFEWDALAYIAEGSDGCGIELPETCQYLRRVVIECGVEPRVVAGLCAGC